MDGQRRLVEGGSERAVGLRIVLGLELGLAAMPERARGVDLPCLLVRLGEHDRKQDVIGIGLHHALELERLEIALGVILQVQDDLGAARHPHRLVRARGLDLEAVAAGRAPDPDLVRSGAAADDRDPVGDDERRVEADAELSDQTGAVLGLRQPAEEGARARARHGAEIVDQLLPVHADAGVADRQGLRLGVRTDPDRQRRAVPEQFGSRDRLVAQLVAGVRRVRDELAQEHVGLGIDRMHHQPQQLGHLGLEWMRLGKRVGVGGHGCCLLAGNWFRTDDKDRRAATWPDMRLVR